MASEVEKLNRKVRRRKIRIILRIVAVFLVVGVSALIAVRYAFRVEKITVINPTEYDSALLLKDLYRINSESLAYIRYKEIENDLKERFPYIGAVSFSPQYPNVLTVRISYDVPFYSVAVPEGYLCLDKDLKVLELSSDIKKGTLLIEGMTVNEYEAGKIIDASVNIESVLISEIESRIAAAGLAERVTKLDFSKKYNITFVLDDLITVELGNSSDLDNKFRMLLEILERNPTPQKAVINVHDGSQGRYRQVD